MSFINSLLVKLPDIYYMANIVITDKCQELQ